MTMQNVKRGKVWLGCTIIALGFLGLACQEKETCTPNASSYCHQGATYSLNSCGELGQVQEECACGCAADLLACALCIDECQEQSCRQQGRECGHFDSACGMISCGVCPAYQQCEQGHCQPVTQACDPLSQAPCLAGEKCSLTLAGDPVCMPVGAQGVGESCWNTDQGDTCARGLMCVAAALDQPSWCMEFCQLGNFTAGDCDLNDSRCYFEYSGYGLCSLPCDPFISSCPDGQFCSPQADAYGTYATCKSEPSTGFVGLGEECRYGDACQPGSYCFSADGSSQRQCLRLCDGQRPCADGACVPLSEADRSGDLGTCEECFARCGERECGPDPVCGSSCGQCPDSQVCNDGSCCSPVCGGRDCGVDPVCLSSCGSCGDGEVCTDQDRCCRPECAGRECGPDPVCGFSCGQCSGVDECGADGLCFCVPDCGEQTCGLDDKCGLSCGSCADNEVCLDGQCCAPDCAGRDCGPDPNCGQDCGQCASGEICGTEGLCCWPDCYGRECGPDPDCGSSCGDCTGAETCDPQGICVCEPQCGDRNCGSDPVCGLSCGSCASGQLCLSGTCCSPDCGGRNCGTDPVCGSSCGSCGADELCDNGLCRPCKLINDTCSSSSQCCQQAGVDIECIYGQCKQCAGYGYACPPLACCAGTVCNPAGMCNTRDCSELGQACFTNSQCCDGHICDAGANHTCQRCRERQYECDFDSQCCAGLSCEGGGCF